LSNYSIHTWPEYNYAALHIFVCGDFEKAFAYLDYLREKLRPMFVKKEIHLQGTNASNKL
jgi:S-adenosylmethionine/arginine decarboxylase-like enzyme